jgi:hypothetical protein
VSDRPPNPTAADGRQSLREHVCAKAAEARAKSAGRIDRVATLRLLDDRSVVRYPVGVRFDAEPLRPGEFACLEALGEHPADGFCLFVHPRFEMADELLPLLIAYYIPAINYGDVATNVEAELYGSTLLGINLDAYYQTLCAAADSTLC